MHTPCRAAPALVLLALVTHSAPARAQSNEAPPPEPPPAEAPPPPAAPEATPPPGDAAPEEAAPPPTAVPPPRAKPHVYVRPVRPSRRPPVSPEERERAVQRHVLHAFDDITLGVASAAVGATLAYSNVATGVLGLLLMPALTIGAAEILRYTVPSTALAPGLSGGFFLGAWTGIMATAVGNGANVGWLPVTVALAGGAAGGMLGAELEPPPTVIPMATTSGVALGTLAALIASAAGSPYASAIGLAGTAGGTLGGALYATLGEAPSATGLMAATGASAFGLALGTWVGSASVRANRLTLGGSIGLGAGMAAGGVLMWALRPHPSQAAAPATPTAWQVHPTLLPPLVARGASAPGVAASLQW